MDEPLNSMTLYPATYDKQTLVKAPEDEALVHFTLAQTANDIFMLQRATLIYLQSSDDEQKPIPFARTSTALFFAQLLAGKLYEACGFITRNPVHARLVPSYADEMPDDIKAEARGALAQIKQYAAKDSLLKRVRQKAAFHYDVEEMRGAYRAFPDSEPFVEYFAPAETNSFYGGASLLSAYAAMGVQHESELKPALNRLMDEVLEVGGWVKTYAHAFMMVFLRRHVDADLWRLLNKNPIKLVGLPRLVHVQAPYFCVASKDDT